jgi:hypothetical protein
MRPDDRARVLHMIETAEAAIDFASGRKPADNSTGKLRLARGTQGGVPSPQLIQTNGSAVSLGASDPWVRRSH